MADSTLTGKELNLLQADVNKDNTMELDNTISQSKEDTSTKSSQAEEITIEGEKRVIENGVTAANNIAPYFVTIAHAAAEPVDMKHFCAAVTDLAGLNSPRVVIGDINTIVDPGEAMGCKPQKGLEDFTNCIAEYRFGTISVIHLARTCSDHTPLLFECKGFSAAPKSSFRFQNMWLQHENFKRVVADSWSVPIYREPMYVLWHKLKRLKANLKHWTKNTFGNIFSQIEQDEDTVMRLLKIYEESGSPVDKEACIKNKQTTTDVWHLRRSIGGRLVELGGSMIRTDQQHSFTHLLKEGG
ncbi:hypothetical protein LIER_42839 [Lithospermum erythrorhizon]|uniref:Uncharacterized protein n=1 Tax=Lithospermum erythrorhizon TaxID=34254 RepID=A0AAV3P0D8_LITER